MAGGVFCFLAGGGSFHLLPTRWWWILPLPLVKDGEEIQVDAPILLPLIGNLHHPAGAVDLAGDVPLLHCVCPGDGFRLVGEGEVAGWEKAI